MEALLFGGLTFLLLAIAAYAQHAVARHTDSAAKTALTRGILALTGVALGVIATVSFAGTVLSPALIFLSAFGMVHVPAAMILFIKGRRSEGRS